MQNRGDARRGGRQVRAHVRPNRGAQPEYRAVLSSGELDFLNVIASVRRRLEVLAAGLGPLDGTIQCHRAETRDEVGRIGRDLAAEPASHFGSDHAQLVFGHAGDDRAQETQDVRILCRVPQRQLAGRAAPLRERRARLHRVRDQPLLHDALFDDDFRVREGGVDVSACHSPVEGLVAGHLGMKLRRPWRDGGASIGDRGQRLVFHVDELERVIGLIRGFGDDDRHDVPDVSDDVAAHALVRGDVEIRIRQQPGAWHRFQNAADVRARMHQHDARRLLRAADVNARDAGVRVRAAQHRRVQHARQCEIFRIRRASGDQPGILATANS